MSGAVEQGSDNGESVAFNQGLAAFERWNSTADEDAETNPHPPGSVEAGDFSRGWKAAEQQHQDDLDALGNAPGVW